VYYSVDQAWGIVWDSENEPKLSRGLALVRFIV
jgi:hypothetical protein